MCAVHLYIYSYQYMCLCVLPKVILPLIISGLFFISVMAAIGRPQFATGPQKCCTHTCAHTQSEKLNDWAFILSKQDYMIDVSNKICIMNPDIRRF